MFSAGLFAGFFGPLILGWISDHYGRRTAIISGAAFFGLFTLASVLAQNLATLIVLRFIAGVGISGVLRRWDPHRHEAADTISILHSGNSSGDRAHKRDLVDAAIPRRNDAVRFLNQIDCAKEPCEHHGSGGGFENGANTSHDLMLVAIPLRLRAADDQ
jgi:hypothetical protein